ncbi:MAG: N-6 DNA methylase [Gallionellaceae bacterium]|nr:N-6 DNA methylase [Gallionellaceae bacterium]
MSRRTVQLAYQAIRIEGGLIPADELARLTSLQTPDATEQSEGHYAIPKGLKLRDEIGRFWKIAMNQWVDFQPLRGRADLSAHDVSVREFLLPLLRDVLGFADLAHGASVEASGHTYQLGYAAAAGRVPLILSAHDLGLDTPADRFGELNPETGKVRRRSPFMLAQEALNASDAALWAVVSNGLKLRILRDNPSLTRPAYIEIDLEAIFTEGLYSDFVAFWLLTHASRFSPTPQHAEGVALPTPDPADCPWERWRNAGQQAGVRARDRLRDGVAKALKALGTGFLRHRDNHALRQALQQEGGLSKQDFFEELLRMVYRLIFLATVEDRVDATTGQPLVFTPDSDKDARSRYLAGYSLTWLRERAARRSAFDTHSDLWQALSITFDGLAHGQPALALPALGGLFDVELCRHLDAAQIENRWLLAAIFQLGYFREPSGLTRVNYRDMGPEELGSVYESLLELVPDPQNLAQPHAARLAFVGELDDLPAGNGVESDASPPANSKASTKGNTRKLTGSYYTPDSLVQELIKSALEPVIADTLRAFPERPVEALLELTICDPACGSGHFLLAAARRLADEVAKQRAVLHAGMPTQALYRHALRDVVSHCIYGVDKNPMAIALAKTALWLESYTPDRPLTFLDHHLQVGDALLGVLDLKVLEHGIPDAAYAVLSGDDKTTAAALKKQNKADLKSWRAIAAGDLFTKTELAAQADAVEHLADASLTDIAAKREAWTRASAEAQHSKLARLADTYVAAFLAPKLPQDAPRIPLSGYLWGLISGDQGDPDLDGAAHALCRAHSVLHWWLAFPQIAARGGFSVLLGNPPWERIKLQEEEFFAARSPLVAMAQNKAKRGERIELLRQGLLLHTLFPDVEAAEGLSPPNRAEIRLHEEFIAARRGAEAASLYAHDSGRYPLTGVGDVNTYALFAESFYQLLAPQGRAGFIVPTGIATDDSTKAYFEAASQTGRLAALYSFENEEFVFPAVHHAMKFCLMVVTGVNATVNAAEFVHYARQVTYLADPARRFSLTPDEFRLINPNTRTCPVFRAQRDTELTKKLYRAAPVLIREAVIDADGQVLEPEVNPWGIRFSTMFHMSNDSGLFLDTPTTLGDAPRLPLYEAKLIHQFDHRWATYVDAPGKPDGLDTEDCTDAQKADPAYTVRPRYWVEERQVLARIASMPTRVASAWLNFPRFPAGETGSDDQDALQTLHFALAAWTAGELFRRAAGEPEDAGDWSHRQRLHATQAAEFELRQRFPILAQALQVAGIASKKAPAEFSKWAAQDAEVGLSDAELNDLVSQQAEPAALLALLDTWMDARSPKWLMGFRGITNATNERSYISTVVPRLAAGNSMPILLPSQQADTCAALVANLGAVALDFVVRQKIGGTNLNFFIVKQFPVIPPDLYREVDLAFIVPRVLELTYTAHDLQPWAEDLGYTGAPFPWNPDRRAQLRAELDAYYAHLYGLTRDELRYILDPKEMMGQDYPSQTFRVLKNNEIKQFGYFRTGEWVLREFDRMALAEAAGEAYTSLLLPPPGQSAQPTYSLHGVVRDQVDAHLAGLLLTMIRQAEGLPRQRLTYAMTMLSQPRLMQSVINPEETETLAAYQRKHASIFDESHLAGDRLQALLRYFEAIGAIRIDQQGSRLVAVSTASLPTGVIVDGDTQKVANILLRAVAAAIESGAVAVEGRADHLAKRA